MLCGIALGNTQVVQIDEEGVRVNPGQLHSERGVWVVAEEEFSGDTQATDLGVTERTYQAVKIAIAAASSGDDNISVFDIPNAWNALNIRAAGITDGGTYTNQIYLGTLGDGNKDSGVKDAQVTAGILPFNCELVNIGQFAWTIGTQESLYAQVAFTSGGTHPVVAGDILAGNTGGATATVRSIDITSGTVAAGTAAGTYQLISRNGTFQSETLNIVDSSGTTISTNVATI